MSLEDLSEAVTDTYSDLGEETSVSLDRETRNELAMLVAAYDPDSADELVRRAVHELFQRSVETGNLDFHLRSGFDCTYDEFLSGMTYEEMAGGVQRPERDGNERRYQF
jgi:hypothetical protein